MTMHTAFCLAPVQGRHPLPADQPGNPLSPLTLAGSGSSAAFCPRPENRALARALIGSALRVYRQLGPELPFACYRTALFRQLRLSGVPFLTGVPCEVITMGNDPISLGRLDFVLGGQLAVQLHEGLTPLPALRQGLLKRMAVRRCPFGVLINFTAPSFRQAVERLVQIRT